MDAELVIEKLRELQRQCNNIHIDVLINHEEIHTIEKIEAIPEIDAPEYINID